MLANYFTLVQIARLIHQHCAGNKISELYSQNRQQLSISVETHPMQTVVVSCVPAENFILLREGNYRARKNSVDVLPDAGGKTIRQVVCDTSDRAVDMELDTGLTLRCELFASRANVILWKQSKAGEPAVAVDAFLRKKEIAGTRLGSDSPKTSQGFRRLLANEELFLDTLRANGRDEIINSLKKAMPVLGSILAKEILLRAEVLPSASVALITDRELKRILGETANIVAELTSPLPAGRARIYYEEQSPLCLSLIPLKTLDHASYESFPDVAAAIGKFIRITRAVSTFAGQRQRLSSWLESEEQKAVRTLGKLSLEVNRSDRADEYELSGRLIMAHLHDLRKGMKTALLGDSISTDSHGQEHSVLLEPALSPVENAEKYFDKARKARSAREESHQRVELLNRRIAMLHMLGDELTEVQSSESLKQFEQRNGMVLREAGYMTKKEEASLPPFRIFTVEGGFQVLAGKNSENNDMLTMKYAKPNDLWFHCRGSGGSHVVLKVKSAHGQPSKAAIHQAASIAAYYSKMKNASSVPVAVTEKKFVRKPKGAPPGTVTLEREKVVFVRPKLPIPSHQE